MGIQYLVSKALLQSSTALNVAMYLLLKSEHASNDENTEADLFDVGDDATSVIQSHPVISRLQTLNKMAQKLQDRVESKVGLAEQMDNLVKANDLMNAEEGESDSSEEDEEAEASDDEEELMEGNLEAGKPEARVSKVSTSSSSDEESDVEDVAATVMNDARFGLRPQELESRHDKVKKRSRRAVPLDYGDDEDAGLSTKASQSLASTINSIEQRSATSSRKKQRASTTETIDEHNDDNEALRQGLEMMEAELGRLDSDNESETNGELDEELSDDPGEDDFYKSVKERSKAKKQKKAAMYAVAPKYPGMDQEIQGKTIDLLFASSNNTISLCCLYVCL